MLPQQLQSTVPSCAQSCLSTYLDQQYFPCTNSNFSCLCSQVSSEGYTLGELAYICWKLDCPQATQSDAVSLYDICSAQPNAASPTHSTLSPPVTSATGTASSTSISSIPHSTTTGSRSSITSQASTSGLSSSTSPAADHQTSTYAAAAAGPSQNSTALTSGQAVGVSVGAFAGLLLIIAIIYIVTRIRRRRLESSSKNDDDCYDFIDKAPTRFSPYVGHRTPPCPYTKSKPGQGDGRKGFDQFGQSPKMHQQPKLGFVQNYDGFRTRSQLLPELPGPDPPQPPPKHPGRVREPPRTPATLFEEECSPTVENFPLPDHRLPTPQAFKVRPDRGHAPVFAREFTQSPEDVRVPPLSIEIPRQVPRNKIPSPVPFQPPPVPQECHAITTDQRHLSGKSQGSTGSVLNYYTGSDAGALSPEDPTPIDDTTQKRRPVPKAIVITKPTYPPRAVRNSGGSDTSFESNDPDEPTPPEEENKSLSPVAEHSPIAAIRYPKVPRSSNQSVPRSPPTKPSPRMISPRMAKQTDDRTRLPSYTRGQQSPFADPSTPDRPPPDPHSLTGSTLAAKRCKNSSAQDLEQKLRIDTSHIRSHSRTAPKADENKSSSSPGNQPRRLANYESPLKGYGRVASTGARGQWVKGTAVENKGVGVGVPKAMRSAGLDRPVRQEVVMRSPMWETKLTPSRRGEDLYLSVSLATPS